MVGDEEAAAPSGEALDNASTSDAPAADFDLDTLIAEYTAQAGSPEQAQPAVQPSTAPSCATACGQTGISSN